MFVTDIYISRYCSILHLVILHVPLIVLAEGATLIDKLLVLRKQVFAFRQFVFVP